MGTGPFRFVSQQIDQDVVIERNPLSWAGEPKIAARAICRGAGRDHANRWSWKRVRATWPINSLPMDSIPVLASRPNLEVSATPGTEVQYLAFNHARSDFEGRARAPGNCLRHRPRADYCTRSITAMRRPAVSLLPASHWAWTGDVARYDYDPARAERLLDEAGYQRGADGVRLHLTIKTSTDERARLLAAVLQQQLARVGIALEIRSNEFATFYADVVRGAFQMYSLYWIGGNEQPDIFSLVLFFGAISAQRRQSRPLFESAARRAAQRRGSKPGQVTPPRRIM